MLLEAAVVDEHGFTLIETTIAVAIVTTGLLTAGVVLHGSAILIAQARAITTATNAAASKTAYLDALAWHVEPDEAGVWREVDDRTTDLTLAEPGSGGRGLTPGGLETFWWSTAGFVEGLDDAGAPAGGEHAIGTRFVRRWAILTVADEPDLLVTAVRLTDRRRADPVRGVAGPGEVRMVSARLRVVR